MGQVARQEAKVIARGEMGTHRVKLGSELAARDVVIADPGELYEHVSTDEQDTGEINKYTGVVPQNNFYVELANPTK